MPLLARVYPNGLADVNHFHAAGGMGFLIRELLDAGLLHDDVQTVWGEGLRPYAVEAKLGDDGAVVREPSPRESGDEKVLAPFDEAVPADRRAEGARRQSRPRRHQDLRGQAGAARHRGAGAWCSTASRGCNEAFKAGELDRRFHRRRALPGPEGQRHAGAAQADPVLGVLQDRGHRVALVTDGRMSGASGKVPAAIHVTPEALDGGPIARIRDGDIIRLDADAGTLDVLVEADDLNSRCAPRIDLSENSFGFGRELFAGFRELAKRADQGAAAFG